MTAPARVVVLDRIADALERIATAMERAHAPKARPLRRDGSPAVVPTDEDIAEVSRRRAERGSTPMRRRRVA